MSEQSAPYIGITIGPIYDTMTVVTKPAALWAASYLFSYISRRLCEEIHEAGVPEDAFVTPFFPKQGDELYPALFGRTDGVGMFHDHIIFRESGDIYTKLPRIRKCVIGDAAEKFGIDESFLDEYVMIAWARVNVSPDTNAILAFSKVLDCLELPKAFVPESVGNELLGALENRFVRDTDGEKLGIDPAAWQLVKQIRAWDEKEQKELDKFVICDIPGIAKSSHAPERKINAYYGILRADGDNMSKILKTLKSDEDLQEFSAICFRYCNEAAKLVGEYGGVTIFAGGDDLFALVPCEGMVTVPGKDSETSVKKHGTVFGLMEAIRKTFEIEFDVYIKDKNVDPKPSLSFGLFLSYEKYPLYEAVERSGCLLFDIAKHTEAKNCSAVELQKHSGQCDRLLIPNASLVDFAERLQNVVEAKREDADSCLLSAGHKIALFRELIDQAEDEQIPDLFLNLFDADFHAGSRSDFLHAQLPTFFVEHCRKGMTAFRDDSALTDGSGRNSAAMTLAGVLRLFQFYVEAPGKEEKDSGSTQDERRTDA